MKTPGRDADAKEIDEVSRGMSYKKNLGYKAADFDDCIGKRRHVGGREDESLFGRSDKINLGNRLAAHIFATE